MSDATLKLRAPDGAINAAAWKTRAKDLGKAAKLEGDWTGDRRLISASLSRNLDDHDVQALQTGHPSVADVAVQRPAGVGQQVDAADRPGRAAGPDRGVEMGGRRRHRGRTPECSRRPAIPGISIVEKGDPGRPAALADLAAPGAAADLLGTFPPEAGPTQAPACRPPRTPVLRLRRSRDDLLRSFTTCSPGAVMTPHHIGGHRSMCSTEHRTRRPWRSGGPAGAVRRQRRSIA